MLFCASEAKGYGADFDGVKGTPVHADRTRLMVWSKVIEVAAAVGWLQVVGAPTRKLEHMIRMKAGERGG